MKYACYCMTRNIYHKVWPSLNSLLQHSDVDRVFLLTEDDEIGFELPEKVRIVNVSGQTYFSLDGPNYRCGWTWMVMMRAALPKVFPDIDRMLSLDLDTIVAEDIHELWDTPIGEHYLAGVPEPRMSRGPNAYVNCGVLLMNLRKMRDGKCDEIIRSLNGRKWRFVEQDCMNALCAGKIYLLPGMYNYGFFSPPEKYPKIWHFAAKRNWYENEPLVQKYKDRSELNEN